MKVFLKAKNEQGDKLLIEFANNWEEREKSRLLSMMKGRVRFDIVSLEPTTIEYYSIDLSALPNNNKSRRVIKANVYNRLEQLGITKENTEVLFSDE